MNTLTLLTPVLAMSSMLNVCTNRPEIWSDIKQAVMQGEIIIRYTPPLATHDGKDSDEQHYTIKQGNESSKKQREYLLNFLEQGRFKDVSYNHDESLVIYIGPFPQNGTSLKMSFPKSKLKGYYVLQCKSFNKSAECINVFFPTPSATTKQ